jgi:hypothetical protein
LDTLNEIKGSTGDQRSEETDSEYYKQMNRTERFDEPKSREPTTPPKSPTIEDYNSGKKKKKNLDFSNL